MTKEIVEAPSGKARRSSPPRRRRFTSGAAMQPVHNASDDRTVLFRVGQAGFLADPTWAPERINGRWIDGVPSFIAVFSLEFLPGAVSGAITRGRGWIASRE